MLILRCNIVTYTAQKAAQVSMLPLQSTALTHMPLLTKMNRLGFAEPASVKSLILCPNSNIETAFPGQICFVML